MTTTPPATIALFLGNLTRVDTVGNLDFSTAALKSQGSTLITQTQLTSAFDTLNASIAYLRENTDPETLDSITEVVSRASAIESSLSAAIASEQSLRETADLVESTARALADEILKKLSIRESVELPVTPSVYADEKQPIAKEIVSDLIQDSIRYDGWYFKNEVKGNKINWYMPISKGLKHKDIHKLYMKLLCVNNVSLPWITVYTVPKNGPDANNKSSWYNSRYNYLPVDGQVFENLKAYMMFVNLKSESPTLSVPLNHTPVELFEGLFTLKSTSASGEDDILAIAISTDSSANAGNVNFILGNVGIQGPDGISLYNFRNAAVLEKFTRNRLDEVYKSFYGKSILDTSFTPPPAPTP